ncbi:MAG: CRISPR-associated protein [Prevotellaceae bacterium]|jgi:hypothetical protein|nr:CRISPR-associated protein [Prevotellaceae bacterium]
MLINLSNHLSGKWSPEQLQAAAQFGKIVDLPFPNVSPDGDDAYIQALSNEYISKIEQAAGNNRAAVHVMGEMTFTFVIVSALIRKGFTCIASTTERTVREENGEKITKFEFKQFRKYISI